MIFHFLKFLEFLQVSRLVCAFYLTDVFMLRYYRHYGSAHNFYFKGLIFISFIGFITTGTFSVVFRQLVRETAMASYDCDQSDWTSFRNWQIEHEATRNGSGEVSVIYWNWTEKEKYRGGQQNQSAISWMWSAWLHFKVLFCPQCSE